MTSHVDSAKQLSARAYASFLTSLVKSKASRSELVDELNLCRKDSSIIKEKHINLFGQFIVYGLATIQHDSKYPIACALGARSIQPKFRPVRPGKEDHLKRWTSFFETFPVGPNRSIEFWTEISGNFGWMDRVLETCYQRSISTYKEKITLKAIINAF